MSLSFKNIIAESIKQNPKIREAVFKFLDSNSHGGDITNNIDDIPDIEDMREVFGFDYSDTYFLFFEWLVRNDKDPIDIESLGTWIYMDYSPASFLQDTGWWDKFYVGPHYHSYDDIIDKKDKKYLKLSSWEEFAPLFNNKDMAERVFGEDHVDFWGYYDYDLHEIWEDIDEKNINYLLDVLIKNYKQNMIPYGEVPDEFDHLLDKKTKSLIINNKLIKFIKNGNKSDLLFKLINSTDLFVDVVSELNNSYHWAYESATEDELFNRGKSEISEFFNSEPKFVEEQIGDKKRWLVVVDVSNIYDDIVEKYMDINTTFPTDDHSYFISVISDVLEHDGDQLNMGDLDYFYPDHSAVAKNFNYNIIENI